MSTQSRLLAWVCTLIIVESAGAVAGPNPHTWQRWEHALTSTRSYDNPYADVTLRVTYTGPAGRTLRTYGFWDGGDTFRIRCAFPAPGTWRWETECSDAANAGLHQQRGTVEVSAYQGDGLLYRHGFLKVSDNRRYLVYGDGTPFLWMGDTAWAVPQRASDEEWEAYLADRAAKHFTLIQVAPASQWAGPTDRQGEKPFTDKACSQWNPAYWQSFERKIQRANEAGLVVLLVGLMEPVHRYPEADKACLFARNIVARLFGNFVIFSPSFDSEFMPLANEVGRAAREATAVHLITQHPGTPWNQPTPTFSDKYYDEPYLDIAAVQTGHNGGHLDWCAHHAIEWILHLYRHEPHKPVINLEAMYDAQGENGWRAVDARSLGWRSWLSGGDGLHLRRRRSAAQGPAGQRRRVEMGDRSGEVRLLEEGAPMGQRLPDAVPARFPGRHRVVASGAGARADPQPAGRCDPPHGAGQERGGRSGGGLSPGQRRHRDGHVRLPGAPHRPLVRSGEWPLCLGDRQRRKQGDPPFRRRRPRATGCCSCNRVNEESLCRES